MLSLSQSRGWERNGDGIVNSLGFVELVHPYLSYDLDGVPTQQVMGYLQQKEEDEDDVSTKNYIGDFRNYLSDLQGDYPTILDLDGFNVFLDEVYWYGLGQVLTDGKNSNLSSRLTLMYLFNSDPSIIWDTIKVQSDYFIEEDLLTYVSYDFEESLLNMDVWFYILKKFQSKNRLTDVQMGIILSKSLANFIYSRSNKEYHLMRDRGVVSQFLNKVKVNKKDSMGHYISFIEWVNFTTTPSKVAKQVLGWVQDYGFSGSTPSNLESKQYPNLIISIGNRFIVMAKMEDDLVILEDTALSDVKKGALGSKLKGYKAK